MCIATPSRLPPPTIGVDEEDHPAEDLISIVVREEGEGATVEEVLDREVKAMGLLEIVRDQGRGTR